MSRLAYLSDGVGSDNGHGRFHRSHNHAPHQSMVKATEAWVKALTAGNKHPHTTNDEYSSVLSPLSGDSHARLRRPTSHHDQVKTFRYRDSSSTSSYTSEFRSSPPTPSPQDTESLYQHYYLLHENPTAPKPRSRTTNAATRKLSSASWISTRSVDSTTLAYLSTPQPGTTPGYLTALGSYLGGSVSPGPAAALSQARDPFSYGSEKEREKERLKDRDSLERITVANRELPPLPLDPKPKAKSLHENQSSPVVILPEEDVKSVKSVAARPRRAKTRPPPPPPSAYPASPTSPFETTAPLRLSRTKSILKPESKPIMVALTPKMEVVPEKVVPSTIHAPEDVWKAVTSLRSCLAHDEEYDWRDSDREDEPAISIDSLKWAIRSHKH